MSRRIISLSIFALSLATTWGLYGQLHISADSISAHRPKLLCAISLGLVIIAGICHHFAPINLKLYATVAGFMTCSGLLLVVNKIAVTSISAPALVIAFQFATCAVPVRLAGVLGILNVEPLSSSKLLRMLPGAGSWVTCMLLNMNSLRVANVDTMVAFRSTFPLVMVPIDYLWFGRAMPNNRSCVALLGVCLSTVAFAHLDSSLDVRSLRWLMAWYSFAILDSALMKNAFDSLKMNTWSRVYYCNTIGIVPNLFIAGLTVDSHMLAALRESGDLLSLCVSSVLGVALTFFAFETRSLVSNTTFLLIGTVCKLLSITVNVVIWDKHSTPLGLTMVFLGLACGFMYQQPKPREESKSG